MGNAKLAEFGPEVMRLVLTYAADHDLDLDQRAAQPEHAWLTDGRVSVQKQTAFDVFARGGSIEEAATASGRALSTTGDYLAEWITRTRPESVSAWGPPRRTPRSPPRSRKWGPRHCARYGSTSASDTDNDIRIVVAHVRGRGVEAAP